MGGGGGGDFGTTCLIITSGGGGGDLATFFITIIFCGGGGGDFLATFLTTTTGPACQAGRSVIIHPVLSVFQAVNVGSNLKGGLQDRLCTPHRVLDLRPHSNGRTAMARSSGLFRAS